MYEFKFNFAEVVIVEGNLIGVVVKCWVDDTYDVYVKSTCKIIEYNEEDIIKYTYDKQIGETDERIKVS